MARGDFAEVTYKTGSGTDRHRTVARRAGGEVIVATPGRGDAFLTVEERSSTGSVVQSARFATTEVVAVVEGNEPIKQASSARKATKA